MLTVKHIRHSGCLLFLLCFGTAGTMAAQASTTASSTWRVPTNLPASPSNLRFVRSFASAQDVKRPHAVLDRTLDIIAGPAEAVPRISALSLPVAIVTDSNRRVLVADPIAKAVHVFDFARSKYAQLDAGEIIPVALALDADNNLYVTDQSSRSIRVYGSTGKFRRQIGRLRGGESYFESPAGIAIDGHSGRIYICDSRSHMLVVMGSRGHVVARIGKRGGGNQPGDFRFPTRVVLTGGEVFVLDADNARVQILDLAGHFKRAIPLAFADHHTGLAVDRERNVYITDPALKAIRVFTGEGQPLYTFNPTASAPEGSFYPAAMWASADDCLYVANSGDRHNISVFQIMGKDARSCR